MNFYDLYFIKDKYNYIYIIILFIELFKYINKYLIMIFLLVIKCITATSLLKNTNSLYEELRYKT